MAVLFLAGCPQPKKGQFEYPKSQMSHALSAACADVRKEKGLSEWVARYEAKARELRETLQGSVVDMDAAMLERKTEELVQAGEEIRRRSVSKWNLPAWDLVVSWRVPRSEVDDSFFGGFSVPGELRGARVEAFYLNGISTPLLGREVKGTIEMAQETQVAVFRMRRSFSTLEACELISRIAVKVGVEYQAWDQRRLKEFLLTVPVVQMANEARSGGF